MSTSGLIVRRTERFEISLPAKVRVAMNHIEMVQFAKGVAGDDRWIDVDVVDFSEGGVGFVSDIFFARSLDLELLIPENAESGSAEMLQCQMQVKRVQMTDRRPGYLIGCSFVSLDNEHRDSIETLISRLLGDSDAVDLDGGDHA